MTTVLEVANNSFKFKEIDGNESDLYCLIDVTVKKVKYKTSEIYYDISYKYLYSSEDPLCVKLNPLLNIEPGYNGEIIFANDLSDNLVKYLLMQLEDLSKFSGRVTAEQYKKQIIKSINLFWD